MNYKYFFRIIPFDRIFFIFLFSTLSVQSICAKVVESKDIIDLLQKSRNVVSTNPDLAIDYAWRAFNSAQAAKDSILAANALQIVGFAYELQGDHDLGLSNYYKALSYCPFYEEGLKASINVSIGTIYGFFADYSKAIELIDNAVSTYKALNDSVGLADAYNSRGLIHIYMGEKAVADKFFTDAYTINKSLNNARNMAANINNMCLNDEDSSEKIKLLNKVIEYNTKTNSLWSLAENYNNLGNLYFFNKEYEKALQALKIAKDYAEKVKSPELIRDNHEYFAKTYFAQKKYELAYTHLAKYNKVSEQIDHKFVKVERRIAEQRVQEQKNENLIQKQQYQILVLKRNITIGIVVLLLIIISIFFLQRQDKRKQNLKIVQAQVDLLSKNKIISDLKLQQQAKELETQTKNLEYSQFELTNLAIFVESRNKLLDKLRLMIKEAYTKKEADLVAHLRSINTYILQFKNVEKKENSALIKEIESQNRGFLERLVAKHPHLSAGGKTLAVFLRINLSTKEIALLTGMSTKSIEMSRYRLRKMLELNPQDNISTYLRDI